MDRETFLKELNNIPDLPTLPVVALNVNRMLQDENVSIKKLSGTIEKDQAMVGKILRLVNSAFYGFRSKINNISHAITILGFSTVRNAIVSIAVIDAFSEKDTPEGFDITAFWKHSVAVAVTGRALAEKSRLASPDETFVAGILHDIGKVILSQHFGEIFSEIWSAQQLHDLSFLEAEKTIAPIDHAQIGGRLAKKWQLPESMVNAITQHHITNHTDPCTDLAILNYTADFIVNNVFNNDMEETDFSTLHEDATIKLERELHTARSWFPTISKEIEKAGAFFVGDT